MGFYEIKQFHLSMKFAQHFCFVLPGEHSQYSPIDLAMTWKDQQGLSSTMCRDHLPSQAGPLLATFNGPGFCWNRSEVGVA